MITNTIMNIDKNVPIPDQEGWKEKLSKLEVGESFAFPEEKRNSVKTTISAVLHRQTNKRFTISHKGQPKGFARVWRIEDKKED